MTVDNQATFDRCLTFVNTQLSPAKGTPLTGKIPRPRAVTISRQAGCGALVVAEHLARYLQADSVDGAAPWTVFDRNLMDRVLADHNLPTRLAKFLPEDRKTELQDIMDELFGLRPSSWTMVEKTSETMLQLAELGSVILIGRGANMVTARIPDVFHVRLVAPLEKRVEHAHKYYNLGKDEAREFCLKADRGRERYLKKYFKADSDDALRYHLVINTGLISFDQAARLIANAATAGRA